MAVSLGIIASSISGHLWEPQGAYDALSTVTLSAATASITFSGIPNTYKHLQIRSQSLNNAGSNGYYCQMRFGNGTEDSGANYASHYLAGQGSTANSGAYTSQTFGRLFGNIGGPVSNNTGFAVVADFLDYANVSKFKTVRSLAGADDNGSGEIGLTSTLWQSTSPINVITLYAFSQGVASTFGNKSQFTLYGIR